MFPDWLAAPTALPCHTPVTCLASMLLASSRPYVTEFETACWDHCPRYPHRTRHGPCEGSRALRVAQRLHCAEHSMPPSPLLLSAVGSRCRTCFKTCPNPSVIVGCSYCLPLLLFLPLLLCFQPLHQVADCICWPLLKQVSTHALQQVLGGLQSMKMA